MSVVLTKEQQRSIDFIKLKMKREAADDTRQRGVYRQRLVRLFGGREDRDAAVQWLVPYLEAFPWIKDKALIDLWEHEKIARVAYNVDVTLEDRCMLLGIDVDAVLEKSGMLMDDMTLWNGSDETRHAAQRLCDAGAMMMLAEKG